ncbi:alpha/beta hydrolase [Chryseobacterium sp. H1D6B]|uniref:alpha/beta hydrolase n=1 Tax=Chryseobacterium sp. H1D6B TaxID=2940588 RepID=UPI0015CDCE06|nr:alpha/beta hydrolase [Chryseobacterium sp. H1D6B]
MRNYFAIILGFLTGLLMITGCKEKTIELGKDISFESRQNTPYGKDPEQKMDLYIPKNQSINTKRNVFIIIHGGGWRGGNKSELTFFTLSMMKQFPNSIFANINYRLASTSRSAIPNQTDDIKNAISYLEKTLGYKPECILLGNSAGGHLSMLFAYQYGHENKVKAVINIVGPSDLSDPNFKNYVDYSFVEKHLIDPKIIPAGISMNDYASPIHWINKGSAPTLSYYGRNDKTIPLSQKSVLDSVLNKNSVINESYEFTGGHLDWDKESNGLFLINKIIYFLNKDLSRHKKAR